MVIYGKPIEVEKKPLDQITHDDLRSLTDRVTMEIQKMSGQEYVNEYAQKVKEQLKAAKGNGRAVEAGLNFVIVTQPQRWLKAEAERHQ